MDRFLMHLIMFYKVLGEIFSCSKYSKWRLFERPYKVISVLLAISVFIFDAVIAFLINKTSDCLFRKKVEKMTLKYSTTKY